MVVAGARYVAGAARSCATAIESFVDGVQHQRVLAHSKVVVGTPHSDGLPPVAEMAQGLRIRSGLALEVDEDPVAAGGAQPVEPFVEELIVVHGAPRATCGRPCSEPLGSGRSVRRVSLAPRSPCRLAG